MKLACTGNIEAPIRGIVIHVALTGMRLAPGVFLRRVVLRFSIVSSARVLRRVQVGLCDKNAMGGRSVSMSGVISSGRWKSAGKRIHPGAPAEQACTQYFELRRKGPSSPHRAAWSQARVCSRNYIRHPGLRRRYASPRIRRFVRSDHYC